MNICQRIHALLATEELTRPEIRERLGLTIDQCENALAILLRLGEVGYNGVRPHRTYFARRPDPLPERRGMHRKSQDNVLRDRVGAAYVDAAIRAVLDAKHANRRAVGRIRAILGV